MFYNKTIIGFPFRITLLRDAEILFVVLEYRALNIRKIA